MVVCLLGAALLITAAVIAPLCLRLGFSMLSMTPSDVIEHGFVEKSTEAFGLVHFQIVARGTSDGLHDNTPEYQSSALAGPGIDFARSQARLRKLMAAVGSLPGVSMTGKRIWLDSMRDWLLSLQKAFDEDLHRGYISEHGMWTPHASENGVLGLRLIVQTDNGINVNRVSREFNNSLWPNRFGPTY